MSLTENFHLIFQPGTDAAHMHKVKVVTVHPLVFDVVDKELQIWRDPRWLDWAQINSNY
jgi:hypothetical protein